MNGFCCLYCSGERRTSRPAATHVAPGAAWASQRWGGTQQNHPHGLCPSDAPAPQLRQPVATSANECNRTESPLYTTAVSVRWVPVCLHLEALLSSVAPRKCPRLPEKARRWCSFWVLITCAVRSCLWLVFVVRLLRICLVSSWLIVPFIPLESHSVMLNVSPVLVICAIGMPTSEYWTFCYVGCQI